MKIHIPLWKQVIKPWNAASVPGKVGLEGARRVPGTWTTFSNQGHHRLWEYLPFWQMGQLETERSRLSWAGGTLWELSCDSYSATPFQVLSSPTGCLKGPMLLFLSSPSPPALAPQSHQPSETKGMKSFIRQGSGGPRESQPLPEVPEAISQPEEAPARRGHSAYVWRLGLDQSLDQKDVWNPGASTHAMVWL